MLVVPSLSLSCRILDYLSPCLSTMRRICEVEVEVRLHAFVVSALDVAERSASLPGLPFLAISVALRLRDAAKFRGAFVTTAPSSCTRVRTRERPNGFS